MRLMNQKPLYKIFRSRQKGQASVDLVGSLIMFTIMTAFIASLSVMLYLNNAMTTAASMGARTAAVESDLADASTFAAGETSVKSAVEGFLESSTGLDISASDITVTGPTGSFGDRTVTVQVSKTITSPLKLQTLLNNLGGQSSPPGTDEYTISAASTMHYEE